MFLVSESIENISTEQKILEYKLGETSYISDEKGSKKVLEGLNSLTFTSSVLRMINFPNDSAFSEFKQIKDFLLNSDAFDLLNTDSMRQGSRSVSQTIGNKGKQIASFIKSLSAEQKEKFNKKINSIYPSIQKIDTKTVKLAGWTSLIAEEKFKNNIKLSSYDLSDGTLRIIAFLALTEMNQFYDYKFGKLEYRTVRFESEKLNEQNHQGTAVINYTETEIPYTRIIEHKHFEPENPAYSKDITVISKEYSTEWKDGMEPFYPVNDDKNSVLYKKYKNLAEKEKNVIFGGRLAEYKYYDMDDVIAEVLKLF